MRRNDAAVSTTLARPVDPCVVTDDDLKYIGEISALLATLNDPRASAAALALHVDKIRVLKLRIERRYQRVFVRGICPDTTAQIALLGNRELEAVLLELLEDIVSFPDGVGSSLR
jgi:hypothetical protein